MANMDTGDIYTPEMMEEMKNMTEGFFKTTLRDGSMPQEVVPITADEKLAMLSMSKVERRRFLADRKEQAKLKMLRKLETL